MTDWRHFSKITCPRQIFICGIQGGFVFDARPEKSVSLELWKARPHPTLSPRERASTFPAILKIPAAGLAGQAAEP
jgi:hypothetical protein